MNELGQNTPAGFLPSHPSVEDVFGRLGLLQNGFAGLKNTDAGKHLAESVERPENELKRSYARFYHGTASPHDMRAMLEDLLNQTLRRADIFYQNGQTLEQCTAHGLMRAGQNGIVIYLLKMMQDGIDLPAPKVKAKGKKS